MSHRTTIERAAELIEYELRSNASPLQVAQSLFEHNMLSTGRVVEKLSHIVLVNGLPVRYVEPQVSQEFLERVVRQREQTRPQDI